MAVGFFCKIALRLFSSNDNFREQKCDPPLCISPTMQVNGKTYFLPLLWSVCVLRMEWKRLGLQTL